MTKLKRKDERMSEASTEFSSCVIVYGGESTQNSDMSYVEEPELREFTRRLRVHSKKYSNINILIFGIDLIYIDSGVSGVLQSSVIWARPSKDDYTWAQKLNAVIDLASQSKNPVLLISGIDRSPFTLEDVNVVANGLAAHGIRFYTPDNLFTGFRPVFKRSLKSRDKEISVLDMIAALVGCPYYRGQLEEFDTTSLIKEKEAISTNVKDTSVVQAIKATEVQTPVTIDDAPEDFEYTGIPVKRKRVWPWILAILFLGIACYGSGQYLMQSYVKYLAMQQEIEGLVTQLLGYNSELAELEEQVMVLEEEKTNAAWDASYDELQTVVNRIDRVSNMQVLTLGPALTYMNEFRVDNFKIQGTELSLVGYIRTERTRQLESQMETTAYNLITQHVQSDEAVQEALGNAMLEPKSFIILDLARSDEFYGLNFNVRWYTEE